MRRMTALERISKWSKATAGGCIEWQGMRCRIGYGRIGVCEGGKMKILGAHRFAYEHLVGPIPDGLCVLHRCDNRACINPEHLFLGTISDNTRDMDAKGRRTKRRAGDKLTLEDARAIKSAVLTKRGDLNRLLERYGISRSHACKIRRGDLWSHA